MKGFFITIIVIFFLILSPNLYCEIIIESGDLESGVNETLDNAYKFLEEEKKERERARENRAGSGNIICVTIVSECIRFICSISDLHVSGGPGDFSKLYDSAPQGTLCTTLNGISGVYQWSAKVDDSICIGSFRHSGSKKDLKVNIFPHCSDYYYYEY